jgi:transcriptional regulator with XRE-family HTH domain
VIGTVTRVSFADIPSTGLDLEQVRILLRSVPGATVGARLSRARKRLGLSIRDLATAAGVNKNSVLRLEAGGKPQPTTVQKICVAMGLSVEEVLRAATVEDEIAVHRAVDDRWYDQRDFTKGPLGAGALSDAERAKLDVPAICLHLDCQLDGGQILSHVIELYGESPARQHRGEEFIYVLKGAAKIQVGNQAVELHEGEAFCFWSSDVHTYAPAEGADLPVRLLSVTVPNRKA